MALKTHTHTHVNTEHIKKKKSKEKETIVKCRGNLRAASRLVCGCAVAFDNERFIWDREPLPVVPARDDDDELIVLFSCCSSSSSSSFPGCVGEDNVHRLHLR